MSFPRGQFYECGVLSKTPLFTEQKHAYCEVAGQGVGHRRPIGVLMSSKAYRRHSKRDHASKRGALGGLYARIER